MMTNTLISPLVRFLKGGERRHYIVSDDKQVVFVVVPKTGCSSIKQSFADGTETPDLPIHKQVGRKLHVDLLTPKQKKYTSFTFVRSPFDRIVSCFVHKIVRSDTRLRGWYGPFAHIKRTETFETFVNKICRIPDILADWHFQSQYSLLYENGKPLFDILNKFETMQQDFEPIQKKFGLQTLPHIHNTKKGDWRDYYTIALAKKVYKRYKQDVHIFQYEKEYQDLLAYLEKKG